ncbi:JOSEPHIN-like protein [Carex rostrata]
MSESDADGSLVYHERQRLQLCLLHALNNLFQQKDAFTRPRLNALAEHLFLEDPQRKRQIMPSLFTPHHNVLSGNYDVNVLLAALDGPPKKKVLWHDRRTPAATIDLASPDLMGIMLNTTISRLRGFWTSRHWLTLKNIRGVWYNLDSHLSAPQPFPNQQSVISFLDDAVAQGGEIFLVFNQEED